MPIRGEAMDTTTSKSLAQAQYDRIWSGGDYSAISELYTEDCRMHDPMFPSAVAGRQGVRSLIGAYRRAFPNLTFSVEDQIAERDRVVTRWTARGTHLHELLGIAATGRQIEVTGSTIARLEAGRVAEAWVHWDRTALFKQLGVVREPAEAYDLTAS